MNRGVGGYQRYQRRLGPPLAAPVKKKPSSHRTSTIRAIHHSTCIAKPSPPRMRASSRTARMIAIVVSFPDMDGPLTHHYDVRQTGCLGLVAQHRALLRAGPAPDPIRLPGRQREGQAFAAYLTAGA